jgi:hypothetical protein
MTALQAWPFVVAAYAIAIGGTLVLVAASLIAMRRAEARADALDARK